MRDDGREDGLKVHGLGALSKAEDEKVGPGVADKAYLRVIAGKEREKNEATLKMMIEVLR